MLDSFSSKQDEIYNHVKNISVMCSLYFGLDLIFKNFLSVFLFGVDWTIVFMSKSLKKYIDYVPWLCGSSYTVEEAVSESIPVSEFQESSLVSAPVPESAPVLAAVPESTSVSASAPEFTPVSAPASAPENSALTKLP